MSAAFYGLVGLMYLGACFTGIYEQKYPEAALALCWGIGNMVIVWMMTR